MMFFAPMVQCESVKVCPLIVSLQVKILPVQNEAGKGIYREVAKVVLAGLVTTYAS